MKNSLFGTVGVRTKVGTPFDGYKKSAGDLFSQLMSNKKENK